MRIIGPWLCLVILSGPSFAEVDSGFKQCYCNGQYREFGVTSQSCQTLCQPGAPARTTPGGGVPRQDPAEASRKRREAERRRAEEESLERQRLFEADRRELCDGLKGGACDDLPSLKAGVAGDLELKGVGHHEDPALKTAYEAGAKPGDTRIGKSGQARSRRVWGDGSGSPAARAWSQLACGASLFGASLLVARDSIQKADLERVRYLGEEVLGALEGREYGAPCPPAPKMRRPAGGATFPMPPVAAFYRAAVAETRLQAERIHAGGLESAAARSRLDELGRLSGEVSADPARGADAAAALGATR